MALYLVLLGKQGAGKSTYMKRLAAVHHLPRISSGELFRHEAKHETELGEKIEEIISRGELVPDAIVMRLLKKRMRNRDCNQGCIFDGFPRTIGQARELNKILAKKGKKVQAAINFTAPDNALLERLTGRRQCILCGKIYNLETMPPKEGGKCDACDSALYHREDDKPRAIRKRWHAYEEKTKPLIGYYKENGILHTIDARGSVGSVMRKVEKVLQGVLKNA